VTDPLADLALRVETVVLATPGVAGLDGGVFGAIATYLPGRRLVGVRVGGPGEPVEVGIVVMYGRPIPDTVDAVRRAVVAVTGPGTEVDVTVGDIATDTAAEATVVVDGPATTRRRRVL
jgi:uncharacterized alkaline shock family protein YloU